MLYSGKIDRSFFRKLFYLAIPIAVQNLISSTLNMVDTMMIGKLGATQIAAVGFANQYFFLFMLICFGTYSGSAIFTSQFWGKKDVSNVRRTLGISLIIGIIISILFTLGGLLIPKTIINLLSDDPQVVNLGAKYLQIVCIGYVPSAISFAYGFSSRSVGNPRLPTGVSAIALVVNTFFNYIFIFGNFGMSPLGISGAAMATVIARIIESILLVLFIYKFKSPLASSLKELLNFNKSFIHRYLVTTTPVIMHESFWALGMTMYLKAYAKLGTSAAASIQVANTIQNLFLIVSIGLGNACAIMVGNKIGSNKKEIGLKYAKTFSQLSVLMGFIMGLSLLLSSPFILKLFDASLYNNCRKIIIVMFLFMPIRMFNSVLITGILRSGGDTKFALILELSNVWLVGVPLAFYGTIYLKLPIYYAYALVYTEDISKAIIGLLRFLSNKWLRNVIEGL